MMMKAENRLPLALLLLRVSVFLVMFVWTVDKFVEPQHASRIMAEFYSIGSVGSALIYVLATLELVILLAFLIGFAKRWSYGLVLLLHAISTLSSYQKYLTNPLPATESSVLCCDSDVGSVFCSLLSPGCGCTMDDKKKQ
jgi:putative oxidoreductase